MKGNKWELNKIQKKIYEKIFGPINSTNVIDIYQELYNKIDSNKEPEPEPEQDEFKVEIRRNSSNTKCCAIL